MLTEVDESWWKRLQIFGGRAGPAQLIVGCHNFHARPPTSVLHEVELRAHTSIVYHQHIYGSQQASHHVDYIYIAPEVQSEYRHSYILDSYLNAIISSKGRLRLCLRFALEM